MSEWQTMDSAQDDALTKEERRWVNRLQRALRDMPVSLEILVGHGAIAICRRGAREASVGRSGGAEFVAELTTLVVKRVYPNSESM